MNLESVMTVIRNNEQQEIKIFGDYFEGEKEIGPSLDNPGHPGAAPEITFSRAELLGTKIDLNEDEIAVAEEILAEEVEEDFDEDDDDSDDVEADYDMDLEDDRDAYYEED